jgi:hypothetical protein
MSEVDYTRVTHDMTLHAANALSPLNPNSSFIFVSGEGADPTGTSRVMWARVKGRTENDIIALSPNNYAIRPGLVVPKNGIESRTRMYRLSYQILSPLIWLIKKGWPNSGTDTTELGDAMIRVAERGYRKRVLETNDIREVGIAASAEQQQTPQPPST